MPRLGELGAEPVEITLEQRRHPGVDPLVGVPRHAQELAPDLAVGLPVEAEVARRHAAKHLRERSAEGAPSRAVAPENRAVDVEEREPHDAYPAAITGGATARPRRASRRPTHSR